MPGVARRRPISVSLALLIGASMLGSLALSACGNDDQPSLEGFCERLETAFGPEGALAADYSEDPSAAKAVVDEFEAIRRVSPLEIEPSLAAIIETSSLVIAAFSGAETAGLDAEQLAASGEAAAELNRYSVEQCGLELDWVSPVVFIDPDRADRIPGEVNLNVPG